MQQDQLEVESILDDIDGGRGARDAVVLPLPSTAATAVTEMRSTVRDIVAQALPTQTGKDVQLVASELVTNALQHGEPPMQMVLHENSASVMIAVYDRGEGLPALTHSAASGLAIIEGVTGGHWGCLQRRGGKWVWAAIPHQGASNA